MRLILKDHVYTPSTLEIPAGKRIKLFIDNQDPMFEEFDSDDLSREKVIPGGKTGFVFIGPLKAGTYHFQGEFHAATAQGVVVVK